MLIHICWIVMNWVKALIILGYPLQVILTWRVLENCCSWDDRKQGWGRT